LQSHPHKLVPDAVLLFILEFDGLINLADLKLGNILMSFENEHIFTDFIKRSQLMQCKVDNKSGQTIYRCHNDFGALDWREIKNMIPKIADFGLATRLDRPATRNGSAGEQLGIYPIEPDHDRAPEEILGCGWDFKADIWNFGVLVRLYTCFQNVNLQQNQPFANIPDPQVMEYSLKSGVVLAST
jgi:serine/threonine protein kinase